MATKYAIGTISTLERLNCSASGNPRYRVTFTDGTVRETSSDAACNYAIGNAEYRDVPLLLTLSRAGRIERINLASADSAVYKIVRMARADHSVLCVVKRGLTLAQAQAHCKSEYTQSGGWFDGYDLM